MLDDTHCVRPIPDLSSMRSVDQSDQSSSTTTFDVQDCPYACVCTGDWADCSFKNNNHRKFLKQQSEQISQNFLLDNDHW